QVLETMGGQSFGPNEVERAKVRVKRQEENRLNNSTAMAQALSTASSLGDWRLLFLQRDRLAAVTADDVNRVARTYFKRQNRTVGLYVPEDSPRRLAVPAAPPLEAVVRDYKGGTATAAGEAFDPTPENL